MMKPIPYVSPHALLSIPSGEKINASLLKKQKKRFLAEFELNNTAEVNLNGVSFDKSGLIAFFDDLEDPVKMSFHQYIDSHPELKAFLETGDLGVFQHNTHSHISQEASFTAEIQPALTPYYCYQFNKVFSNAFKKRDWESLSLINESKPLVAIDNFASCYQDTYQHVQLKVESLEELAEQIKKGENPGPEVQEACDEMIISVLNQLPDHFEGLRNAYGIALEELAMGVYNEHKRARLTKLILRQGMKLSLNQDTKSRLEHVLDQLLKLEPDDGFFPEMEQVVSQGTKKIKSWHVVVAGLVLIPIAWFILN